MRIVALLSGGKDSLYNLYLAKKEGHKLVGIANLKPPDEIDELDSYMYQTVGHQAIEFIARALNKPLFQACITGTAKNKDLNYKDSGDGEDEVEQLFVLLNDIKQKHGIPYDGISVGAIASSYQKSRVANVCKRLNLTMFAYLWNKDQDMLLQSMIDKKFHAVIVKVACMGLAKKHIGLSIKEIQEHLRKLNEGFGANMCGEGGEYETLVLDCPLYKKRIVLDLYEIVCHSTDVLASVYYMKPIKMRLARKWLPLRNCRYLTL